MLFAAGCATSPTASISPSELGNAYRVTLPAGTIISLPTQESHRQVAAVAVNETAAAAGAGEDGGRALLLTAPLQLVSPAHTAERDAAEARLALRILELDAKLNAPK